MNTLNRDSARTRMRKALIELMKDNHYSKIKVSDIIKQADVNRSTFYRNYDDIFDMYKHVCNNYIDYMIEPVREIQEVIVSDRTDLLGFMRDYYDYVMECIPDFKILIGRSGDMNVLFNFRYALFEETERIADAVKENAGIDVKDDCILVADFFSMVVLFYSVPTISLEKYENLGYRFRPDKLFIENASILVSMSDDNHEKNEVKKP